METEAQTQCLHRLGCTKMQGYLFGHPQPAEAAIAYLEPATDVRWLA